VQICGCNTLQLWVAVAPPPTNTYVLELAVGLWVQFVVCGLFLDCRKGWCRNRRLVEVRAAGIEITARDLSSSSFMINPLPPKTVAACLCHCKARTSAKEEKILLISFTWALLAGIDDHVLLFLQQSCRTNATTTGTRGEGGG
jgi:hypothetical protein